MKNNRNHVERDFTFFSSGVLSPGSPADLWSGGDASLFTTKSSLTAINVAGQMILFYRIGVSTGKSVPRRI